MLWCATGLEREGKKRDAWETGLRVHVDIVIQPQIWKK
jgi:hypothetical protein